MHPFPHHSPSPSPHVSLSLSLLHATAACRCVVDYHGLRFVAAAIAPIVASSDPLYGSRDGGVTVADGTSDPVLADKMQALGECLNLTRHLAGASAAAARALYTACDVEVHKGSDGKFYMLDNHRLIPPEAPSETPHLVAADNSPLYRYVANVFTAVLQWCRCC